MPLDLALSPYHLATREAPAMLALILGDRVVTLMPRPTRGDSREGVRQTVEAAPRYLRLMESWRWSGPLWRSGVLASAFEGDDATSDLEGVYADIDADEALTSLRPLVRTAAQRAAESPDKSLDFIAADVLKGGPDPGINIPITAAVDRFAVRHDCLVVRGGTPSLAQRAEARLGRRAFSFAMPVLLRAGGGRVQRLRDDLAAHLSPLRDAVDRCARAGLATPPGAETPADPGASRGIQAAAAAFADAFAAWAPSGASGDDENAERVVAGYVSVAGMVMPADAVLRSSRAALRAMQGAGVAHDPPDAPIAGPRGPMFALFVREMSLTPER
jgi:hypothetical protein